MEKLINLAATQEFEELKRHLPRPFALKLKDIRNEDKPTSIYCGIIDLFEKYFLFMTYVLLSQYFFDRLEDNRFLKNEAINKRLKEERWKFSDKIFLMFDILKSYREHTDLLPIENMYHTLLHPHDDSLFVGDVIRELKQTKGVKDFLHHIDGTHTLENFTILLITLRNRWAHDHLPKKEILTKFVETLWHAVIQYFSAMKFFQNYSLGYLWEKRERHGTTQKELDFLLLRGSDEPERFIFLTDDREFYDELELEQVYLGSFALENKCIQFNPTLSLHPLIIYKECTCSKCAGKKSLFFADSLKDTNFSYKGAMCSESLKPDDLRQRIKDFFELLFNPLPEKDLKTFKRLKFLKERYKALYRDFVILALKDGVIENSEKVFLESQRKVLKIESAEAKKIEMEVRNNPEIRRNIKNFLSSETKLKVAQFEKVVRMAWMDGHLAEGESEEIEKIREMSGIRKQEAENIINSIRNEPEIVKKIKTYNHNQQQQKEQLYKNIFELAIAGGTISEDQLKFLEKKKQELQIDEKLSEKLEKEVKNKIGLQEISEGKEREKWLDSLVKESVAKINNKDFDGAVQLLGRAVFYETDTFLPYQLLGYIYMEKTDYQRACNYFFKSFLLNGKDFKTNFYLSRSLYKLKKAEQAALFAENCTRLEPENPDAYVLSAHINYKYLEDDITAIDILTKGLEKCEGKKDSGKIYELMIKICKEKDDKEFLQEIVDKFKDKIGDE